MSFLEIFMDISHLSGPVEFVYCSHPRWPLPPDSAEDDQGTEKCAVIDIAILDSSFNPPTLAHVALSQLHKPPSAADIAVGHSNATMLLYSVKNADKVPKPGDATPSERIEMMVLFAQHLESLCTNGNQNNSANIAVAVCQEPVFVNKSKILRTYFSSRMTDLSPVLSTITIRLTFLMGTDTLERLFMPKYYGSENAMQVALETLFSDSHVICAKRAFGASYQHPDTVWIDRAKDYIASGAITLEDIDEGRSTLSSSEVRKNIQLGRTSMWKSQVLDTIAQYIEEKDLYREN